MTNIYLAASARKRLEAAQAALDQHIAATDGRCVRCGALEPCMARAAAEAIFVRYRRLPVRTPGRTLNAAISQQNFAWLDRSATI